MITVDYVAIAGNMLAMIATKLAKHTLTLWVTLVPMEINTINGENNSPEVRLELDREKKKWLYDPLEMKQLEWKRSMGWHNAGEKMTCNGIATYFSSSSCKWLEK